MEDDRNRLMSPLKSGWNLILENILEQDQSSPVLGENHQALQNSLDQLNQSLHQLSQYRHQLNCRLETIKQEVEKLQLQSMDAQCPGKIDLDRRILKLEEEGYSLQLELETLEKRLKQLRVLERNKSELVHR